VLIDVDVRRLKVRKQQRRNTQHPTCGEMIGVAVWLHYCMERRGDIGGAEEQPWHRAPSILTSGVTKQLGENKKSNLPCDNFHSTEKSERVSGVKKAPEGDNVTGWVRMGLHVKHDVGGSKGKWGRARGA